MPTSPAAEFASAKPLPIFRINPAARDDFGAVVRPYFRFEVVDNLIHRRRIEQVLLGEDGKPALWHAGCIRTERSLAAALPPRDRILLPPMPRMQPTTFA